VKKSRTQLTRVQLPVSTDGPDGSQVSGTTEYISSRYIRFALERWVVLGVGDYMTVFVNLPAEVTGGQEVHIRIRGHVQCVEHVPDLGMIRLMFTVCVKNFDFVRKDHVPDVVRYERNLSFLAAAAN
jgi:hypothetical protein